MLENTGKLFHQGCKLIEISPDSAFPNTGLNQKIDFEELQIVKEAFKLPKAEAKTTELANGQQGQSYIEQPFEIRVIKCPVLPDATTTAWNRLRDWAYNLTPLYVRFTALDGQVTATVKRCIITATLSPLVEEGFGTVNIMGKGTGTRQQDVMDFTHV